MINIRTLRKNKKSDKRKSFDLKRLPKSLIKNTVYMRGGASKVFGEDESQIKQAIDYYRKNAEIITNTLDELNKFYVGGKKSPYVFFECPNNMNSWDFFDLLLEKANIIGTPGSGFGENGKTFFRLTSFSSRRTTIKAMSNFKKFILSLRNEKN